jgi:hypothetical protein
MTIIAIKDLYFSNPGKKTSYQNRFCPREQHSCSANIILGTSSKSRGANLKINTVGIYLDQFYLIFLLPFSLHPSFDYGAARTTGHLHSRGSPILLPSPIFNLLFSINDDHAKK